MTSKYWHTEKKICPFTYVFPFTHARVVRHARGVKRFIKESARRVSTRQSLACSSRWLPPHGNTRPTLSLLFKSGLQAKNNKSGTTAIRLWILSEPQEPRVGSNDVVLGLAVFHQTGLSLFETRLGGCFLFVVSSSLLNEVLLKHIFVRVYRPSNNREINL